VRHESPVLKEATRCGIKKIAALSEDSVLVEAEHSELDRKTGNPRLLASLIN
jgi:hypothetical protein